jgi:hypothetical protein
MKERIKTIERHEHDNSLTAETPTLQMHCVLPTGMTFQASGYARFREMPVTIGLSERVIRRDFFVGLDTPLGESTRPYLSPFGSRWLARLGETSVELTPA